MTTSGTLSDPVRYHDLDALRAGAMLLGIALHGSLSFLGWEIWPVQDIRQSQQWYGLLAAFIHGFRMQLFFLLSGFFTAMMWRKRGIRSLLAHRAKRILLPLILGTLVIIPVINLLSVAVGQQVVVGSGIGLLFYPHGFFIFHHLWFLYYLVWLVLGFVLVVWLVPKGREGQPTSQLAPPPFVQFLALVGLTYVFQWQFDEFGPATDVYLVPGLEVLGYYALFFGFGAISYGKVEFFEQVTRRWWVYLVLAIPCLLIGGTLSFVQFTDYGRLHPWATLFSVLYAWLMCCGSIGLFRKFFSQGNPRIRYLSDSAYFLYLAHIPVLLPLQHWVRDWDFPSLLKFLLVCIVATGVLLVVYRYFVRYTWVGTMLNGKRVG